MSTVFLQIEKYGIDRYILFCENPADSEASLEALSYRTG